MRLIIISFFNGFLWADKFTDVDCARIGELFKMICQILQMITQIMSLRNIFLECVLLIFNFFLFSLFLHSLHGFGGIRLSVVLDCL